MKTSKITKWALVFSIIIILNLFFGYAIKLFYEEPQFDNYCPSKQVDKNITSKESCLNIGGAWNESENSFKPLSIDQRNGETFVDTSTGWCNKNYTCNQSYQEAKESYEKNVFILLVSLGVIAIVIGVFSKIEVLSISMMGGGILSLIISSIRYWQYASDILHLAILAIALAFLIWIAVKKFNE